MNDNNKVRETLKKIPSVESIIQNIPDNFLDLPHKLLVKNIRKTINQIRKDVVSDNIEGITKKQVIDRVLHNLEFDSFSLLKAVINGTGIILHTGLGRAPISKNILQSSINKVYPYCNIEFDNSSGNRGERNKIVENMINSLTTAESSIVVNNNAAAVLLMLSAIANGKDVLISRGQQVEIGGSFRIPDVIVKSGCNMIEIGTTNKTHIRDYEKHINKSTGAILYAHTSNYKVVGFTQEVEISELANLAKRKKIPLLADIGSGAVADLSGTNIPYEKMVEEYIHAGVDVVSFSGDKLLGGAQSGIIVGKKKIIKKIHNDPMYRALRCDKITFAILDSILRTYKSAREVSHNNLTHRLFLRDVNELSEMGNKILSLIKKENIKKYDIKIEDSTVEAGSGSLPTEKIPSKCISFGNTSQLKASEIKLIMLSQEVPIIGFIKKKKYHIDLKAVTVDQVTSLSSGINKSLK